ncbi:hypothetical protein Q7P37_010474 [Cladosporium fusiforme]
MNLGNIPGYYYEKKKYFKVTANHAAQSLGEKYTKQNVRHERQVAKKRKVEQRAEKKRQAQTIKRSKLLAFPEYAGIGIGREVGSRPHAIDRIQADEAFVSQLQYEDQFFARGTVLSAHALPSANQTLFTSTGMGPSYEASFIDTCTGVIGRNFQPQNRRLTSIVAFSSRVMSTSVWPAHDPHTLLACASGGSDNVYIGGLGNQDEGLHRPSVFLSLGDNETTLWDSAISPTGETAAIAASDRVRHISTDGRVLSNLRKSASSRAVSWLNPTTIAASSAKTVLLWDTRAKGSSPRFSSPHTITGLRTVPSSSGTQLLISTNHGLSLHDTRMPATSTARTANSKTNTNPSTPLLHFPLLHEGPQLTFTINARSLIAFSAQNGAKSEIRLASLRTGRVMRTLQAPKDAAKRPTQLAWQEDERGVEFLQACMGERVGRWSWNAMRRGEEDG